MKHKSIAFTITLQLVCWGIIAWILVIKTVNNTQAESLYQITPTPEPFLGPIYYGRKDVLNVFDHELPCASVCEDGNNNVLHHNGTLYLAVTGTPNPSHTATPEGWPPPTPYIPNDGFGYDEHGGLDYLLKYVPVLAAADGIVIWADWHHSTNHRLGYGLYVQLDHGTYTTLYGHLSVINVQAGEDVVANPSDRNSILGISGNTGSVFGGCPDVGADPLCGAHLHFEPRLGSAYKPVDPYGWISTTMPDPWASATATPGTPRGAESFVLWATPPSLVSGADQYPNYNSDPVPTPAVNNARMIIDDGSADFGLSGPCTWEDGNGNNSYNNSYYWAESDSGAVSCTWHIQGDAFTPAGDYDLFVHIPNDPSASLGVEYTIQHNGESSVAVVVQAAYLENNTEHDAWAYLGRYDFAMNNQSAEFVRLPSGTIISDVGSHVLADAIMLAPADDLPLPQEYIYVSFAVGGMAGNVAYNDEDILSFNTDTGEWRMFFDGSDVGLSAWDVDAAEYRNGNLFFSVDTNFGSYKDADIIRFTPTSLGENTSGSMSLALAGGNYLSKPDEDVDALSFMNNGHYLLSTIGTFSVPNVPLNQDEDLFSASLAIMPIYSAFLDGSAIGLADSSEDIDGLWLDTTSSGTIGGYSYLSTEGNFTVTGSSGDGADIIRCQRGSITSCAFAAGLFWNASAHGIGNALVDGLFLSNDDLLVDCPAFTNGGFEAQFFCWEATVNPNPAWGLWRPATIEKHTGLFSAEARVEDNNSQSASLTSSPIQVHSNHAYRFRFWAKGVPDIPDGTFQVFGRVHWYTGENFQSEGFADIYIQGYPEWSEFDSGFICPPTTEVDSARIDFELATDTLLVGGAGVGSIFIDDVTSESQTQNCPILGQD